MLARSVRKLPMDSLGRRMGVLAVRVDAARGSGVMTSTKTLKRAADKADAEAASGGPAPASSGSGRREALPGFFWEYVISSIQLCQVAGTEFQSKKMRKLLKQSLSGSRYQNTSKGNEYTEQDLMQRMKTKIAEFVPSMGPDKVKQRSWARWAWAVREIYEEWWKGLESWLIGIGFCYRDVDDTVCFYPGKEFRLFNNDETQVNLSEDQREPTGRAAEAWTDASLPRPGVPSGKVRSKRAPLTRPPAVCVTRRAALRVENVVSAPLPLRRGGLCRVLVTSPSWQPSTPPDLRRPTSSSVTRRRRTRPIGAFRRRGPPSLR